MWSYSCPSRTQLLVPQHQGLTVEDAVRGGRRRDRPRHRLLLTWKLSFRLHSSRGPLIPPVPTLLLVLTGVPQTSVRVWSIASRV